MKKTYIEREAEILRLYEIHGAKFFYRNGRKPTPQERSFLSAMKRKDKADKERKKYVKNPIPGKPVTFDSPRHPLHCIAKELERRVNESASVSGVRGAYGIQIMRAVNGLASNMFRRGIGRDGFWRVPKKPVGKRRK